MGTPGNPAPKAKPAGLLSPEGWTQMFERRRDAVAKSLPGGLGVAAGPFLGGRVVGTARAAPEVLSALVRGDVVGADRAIQRGITRQEAANTQFRNEHPAVATVIDHARRAMAPVYDTFSVPIAKAAASQVRQVVDIERHGKNRQGEAVISERMPYPPQTFAGAEGIVQLGRPPGFETYGSRIEYGLESPKVVIENGDFRGVADAYWRGGKEAVALKSANAAHGGHFMNVGPSYQDLQNFDERVSRDPNAVILPVWSKSGVATVATTKEALEKMPKYKPFAEQIAVANRKPTPGGKAIDWTPQRDIYQFHIGADGYPIMPEVARRQNETYRATPEGKNGDWPSNKKGTMFPNG